MGAHKSAAPYCPFCFSFCMPALFTSNRICAMATPFSCSNLSPCGRPWLMKQGVDAFHIAQYHQLLKGGMVPYIALGIGVGLPPLNSGFAEKGHVQQVGLAGIYGRRILLSKQLRDEVFLDRIGMDAVIDLGQNALDMPALLQPVVFFCFQALELYN
jgi:hypothetical protein